MRRIPRYSRAALVVSGFALMFAAAYCGARGQEAPPASGARILLLPARVVSGDRATLAVLDVAGRLTPGVKVQFSDGDQLTTDATGRALFVAPLNVGALYASITGRPGRVVTHVTAPSEATPQGITILTAPRFASLSDRFEVNGTGFCGDADRNTVGIGARKGLVLAASPKSLLVLPPQELGVGPEEVSIACGKEVSRAFHVTFVSLTLDAEGGALAPEQHRTLKVHIQGTTAKVMVEARNLAPEVVELTGGKSVKSISSGGEENQAEFQITGKQHGNMLISMRLVPLMTAPQ